MKLLKTYTVPTDLFVSGANISKTKEDEELCVFITDDYCSGQVKGNKNTDEWIETEGSMVVLTIEQLKKAINKDEDRFYEAEEMGVIEITGFTGDVYVRLIDDEGKDCLKENPDLEELLVYQYREELENEWRDVELLFSGNYIGSQKKELKDYSNLIEQECESNQM